MKTKIILIIGLLLTPITQAAPRCLVSRIPYGMQVTMTNGLPAAGYFLDVSSNLINWAVPEGLPVLPSDSTGLIRINIFGTEPSPQFFRFRQANFGLLSFSTDTTSPSLSLATGGTVGVIVGVIRLHASPEPILLQEIGLKLRYPTQGSINQITLWSGNTQIGAAIFIGTNLSTISILGSPIVVQTNFDQLITFKADLAEIGVSFPGASGSIVAVDFDNLNPANTRGIGLTTGNRATAIGETVTQGVATFRSFPKLLAGVLPSTDLWDGRLLQFTLEAKLNGNVSVAKVMVSLTLQNAVITSLAVYGYTDSNYSLPIAGVGIDGLIAESGPITNPYKVPLYFKDGLGNQSLVTIPAGEKRYFQIRARGLNLGGGFSSIATSLLTDTVGKKGSFSGVDSSGYSQFIWSPNSLGASNLASQDWFNGYLIPSGISQNRYQF